jgi:NAD(P)-dependent dehydrogenase (short-subunit alcohol dehydrogenase family)
MNDSPTNKVALVIGASRGIGLHLTNTLIQDPRYGYVYASCRDPDLADQLTSLQSAEGTLAVLPLDVFDHKSIAAAAASVKAKTGRLDLLIYCAGILHAGNGLQPEKRLADVRAESLSMAFQVNASGGLLVAREFEPLLRAGSNSVFAALSARVGSIGDNRKGGWYAYRASKAALNMMIKTLAVEWGRLPRPISCYVLHPGTVATELSAPFRGNLPPERIFPPNLAALQLLATIDDLTHEQSGGFFAYDGSVIEW